MNDVTRSFLLRALKFIAFWVVVGVLLYFVGRYFYLFVPFVLAFVFTLVVNPLKNFLHRKWHLPVGLAVVTAMVVELGSVAVVVTILVNQLIQEIRDVYWHWPQYTRFFEHHLTFWLTKVETIYLKVPNTYAQAINERLTAATGAIPNLVETAGTVLEKARHVAVFVPEAIIVLVIALVATYFMAKGTQRYLRDFVRIFPQEWHEHLLALGQDFSRAFIGFIKAEFIVFLVTITLSIGGLLIIRAKYAIMLGTITGIFGILPVLGVGIILIPWAVLAFLAGKTLLAIELLLLTGLISVLRHIIEPKILGDNVGLDPLLVLASIYIGLAATGAVGLILGPFILIAYRSLQKAGVYRNL